MNHVLIVTGGYLNIDFAKAYIETLSIDRVFAVDKGLEYVDRLGLNPDYIVGDFDTVDKDLLAAYEKRNAAGEMKAYVDRYPAKKDATDTELAVAEAIKEKAGKITILAATGNRLDHVLANLGLLFQAAEENIECQIVDENNRIRILQAGKCCRIKKRHQYGTYLSLIPISPIIKGLTITGVMYPLNNRTVIQGSSLTVSNQIKEETAIITITEGNLLVIESKDW